MEHDRRILTKDTVKIGLVLSLVWIIGYIFINGG